jgi:hypothetical protein
VSYIVVLPSIDPVHTNACLATCKIGPVLVVDNTEVNRGVPASWNDGIALARKAEADWLVILSAGVRFSADGGQRFIDQLADQPSDTIAVEADAGLGWHLIAFARHAIEACGTFDENFTPGYWEDNDYGYRLRLLFPGAPWPKVPSGATLAAVAHGLKSGKVEVDFVRNEAYYTEKWGGPSAAETFTTPFDSGQGVNWWPWPAAG